MDNSGDRRMHPTKPYNIFILVRSDIRRIAIAKSTSIAHYKSQQELFKLWQITWEVLFCTNLKLYHHGERYGFNKLTILDGDLSVV